MHCKPEIWTEWSHALGQDSIIFENDQLGPFEANVTGLEHRLAGVLQPKTVAEVQAAARIAGNHGAVLHPISCGRNWGYGSRQPCAPEGTVLLDLSRMHRIRNVDSLSASHHVAEIEPGVTQGQMADTLAERDLPLLFNVTGAGTATSLLGNSLERGVGYFGLRTADLSDLEVVLGTGELLRTGPGHLSQEAAARFHYPHGLGPSLDGLFFQSTLGIVTGAGFRLIPRREHHATLIIKLKEAHRLAEFIDCLAGIRWDGLVECVMHVGSPNRVRVTLSPMVYRTLCAQGQTPGPALRQQVETQVRENFPETWTAVGPLFGTKAQVAAAYQEIESRLTGLGEATLITETELHQADDPISKAMLQPLVDLCLGRPTDGALDSPVWSIGGDPLEDPTTLDVSDVGIRFCSPALPLDGETVSWAVSKEESVLQGYGFEPYLTLNVIDTKSALLITNLCFKRSDPEAAQRAQEASQAVFAAWQEAGIYPYRLGIGEGAQFPSDPIHTAILQQLKSLFDPKGVLGTGRYP